MTVYRVHIINGRFDHVVGKAAAIKRAAELTDAPEGTPLNELTRHWGVTLERVSASYARSVGLGHNN